MNRVALRWGGAAAALLGLGTASFAAAVVATATPEAHVLRYLEALADDDLIDAARLAGLSTDAPLPLGDDGEPTVIRIIDRLDLPDGDARVIVEYGTEQDAVTTVFTMTPSPAHLGLVPVWHFDRPPVSAALVGVDRHDRLQVNGQPVHTVEAGRTIELAAFVPSRLTAHVTETYLRADTVSRRTSGPSATTIMLTAEPTDQLLRIVLREIEQFILECTTQQVLQPTGCPFGRTVSERVVGLPTWRVVTPPEIEIAPSMIAGRWNVAGDAQVQLTAQVQRLRDGQLRELDETVTANISGEVVLTDDGPELTIYPPRD